MSHIIPTFAQTAITVRQNTVYHPSTAHSAHRIWKAPLNLVVMGALVGFGSIETITILALSVLVMLATTADRRCSRRHRCLGAIVRYTPTPRQIPPYAYGSLERMIKMIYVAVAQIFFMPTINLVTSGERGGARRHLEQRIAATIAHTHDLENLITRPRARALSHMTARDTRDILRFEPSTTELLDHLHSLFAHPILAKPVLDRLAVLDPTTFLHRRDDLIKIAMNNRNDEVIELILDHPYSFDDEYHRYFVKRVWDKKTADVANMLEYHPMEFQKYFFLAFIIAVYKGNGPLVQSISHILSTHPHLIASIPRALDAQHIELGIDIAIRMGHEVVLNTLLMDFVRTPSQIQNFLLLALDLSKSIIDAGIYEGKFINAFFLILNHFLARSPGKVLGLVSQLRTRNPVFSNPEFYQIGAQKYNIVQGLFELAVAQENTPMAEFLLKMGAHVDGSLNSPIGKRTHSPLQVAFEHLRYNSLWFLIQKGLSVEGTTDILQRGIYEILRRAYRLSSPSPANALEMASLGLALVWERSSEIITFANPHVTSYRSSVQPILGERSITILDTTKDLPAGTIVPFSVFRPSAQQVIKTMKSLIGYSDTLPKEELESFIAAAGEQMKADLERAFRTSLLPEVGVQSGKLAWIRRGPATIAWVSSRKGENSN